MNLTFREILLKYRSLSFSEHDKGSRFERLMKAYLLTEPIYASQLKKVWLWNEFPGRNDLGGTDTGIDLVALTNEGDYWAIQCKCYLEDTIIDKPEVDSFLSTSSREFRDEDLKTTRFAHRIWISTTNKWGTNATKAIQNQNPPVTRINLYDLQEAKVDWGKLEEGILGDQSRNPKKTLFPHQIEALNKVNEYFKTANRGKLIMACGTGKTYNSLRIAENETNGKGLILFLVPSIALLGQALREWSSEAQEPIKAICICSDSQISSKRFKDDDTDNFSIVDLALPASTDTNDIIRQFHYTKSINHNGMTVVFSTYQSIEVIAEVQKCLSERQEDFGEFDLIICDEAHRTTGVTLSDEDSSVFVKVHDNNFIKGKKRLYMTATPRLYSDDVKSRAVQSEAILCSMDDPNLYGEEIYRIGFGEAVDKDLLTDYKVLILTLSDKDVPPTVQKMIADYEGEINTDDIPKLIGCVNALSKQILGDEGIVKTSDPEPMRRAVAFCQTIADSKKITEVLNTTTNAYINSLPNNKRDLMVRIDAKHIDGTMSAPQRDELMGWLKSEIENNECHVLTNVRCLSEGVDVPSLDSVVFLSARNSQIDVVQSVGRVMRKSPGKKYGYIIIPIVVPSDVEADKALDDNERYKVVWTVLNALRAHDDRFNATVNKIELNKKRPEQILVSRPNFTFDDNGQPTMVTNDQNTQEVSKDLSVQLAMQFEQLQNVVFARMVKKVGDRRYWEQWAKNVAEIAEKHVEHINKLIQNEDNHKKAFEEFLIGLRKNINPNITQQEAVEMLSQHIITKPVFEALFEGYSFVKHNAISVSMQNMLDLLHEESVEKDTAILNKFYESVRMRAADIDNAEGKQRIIVELYDKFFKTAFPKMVEKLGIVYTPVEVVDFIIHSVNDILIKEFGRSIGDENIHILDPFTGTGTFITRLIQSGLIDKEHLPQKYHHEMHANEMVLLAYYIAAVNIENAYHDVMNEADYKPFDGICLTDTFQLGESDESEKLFSNMFTQNSERVVEQKKTPIQVIIGNPPYSGGQKSANDNARNQRYPKLEQEIAKTYAALTNATNKNSLYNSYIKAFRWSSDRLDHINGGIICFVSDGAWLDGNATAGFRKCLEKEFSSIYVFNLRGNARTQGELRRKEAGNVFGEGSRSSISITLLVKNPLVDSKKATIFYHDIGDYLNRKEKLNMIKKYRKLSNPDMYWQILTPNQHGDWISQRNDVFDTFIQIGDKDNKNNNTFFLPYYSNGLKTQRDAWCYSSSLSSLKNRIEKSIDFYNSQRNIFQDAKKVISNMKAKDYISYDKTKFSWTDNTINGIDTNKNMLFEPSNIITSIYRPFFKQYVYFSRSLNERVYQMPKIFPNKSVKNLVICIPGPGNNKRYSVLIADTLPDLGFNSACQCFPLYYYEERQSYKLGLFDNNDDNQLIRRDGISDFVLKRSHYMYGKNVTKEDIFYYVYGFLHSHEYQNMFINDLKKMLPRLPLVENVQDFWKFTKAGRELANLHINYERIPAYTGVSVKGNESGFYKVEKMRFPKKEQKDTIIYNNKIYISDIPAKAYEYTVNGKSAIECIMDRYQVTIDKDTGIKDDPNDWAIEVGNPRYILDLLLSIINVSVQSVDIIQSLPKLNFTTVERTNNAIEHAS